MLYAINVKKKIIKKEELYFVLKSKQCEYWNMYV